MVGLLVLFVGCDKTGQDKISNTQDEQPQTADDVGVDEVFDNPRGIEPPPVPS